MTDRLSFMVTAACLIIAMLVGIQGARARYRWQRIGPVIGTVEVSLLMLAVVDLLQAGRPTGVHIAYVGVSVALLPIVCARIRHYDGRWAAALLAVALLVCAVIVVRMATTGRAGA